MKLTRIALVGVLIAAFGAGTCSMAAHPTSGIVSIGRRNGDLDSLGAAINAKGHVAGYSDDPGGMHHAVLWNGKTLQSMGEVHGDLASAAGSLNAKDLVVGIREDPTPAVHAVLWKKAKPTSLPELPGSFTSVATAINDAGVVVGASEGQTGIFAVMWTKGKVQALTGIPGDVVFLPESINKKGQIAGVGQDQSGNALPYIWYQGDFTQLPVLDASTTTAEIRSINSSGVAVGDTLDNAGKHAVIWRGNQVSELTPRTGDQGAVATGINDGGDVIGLSYNYGTPNPVIWPHGGQPVTLSSLLPGGSPFTIGIANGINAKGQITGAATHGSAIEGFVYTP